MDEEARQRVLTHLYGKRADSDGGVMFFNDDEIHNKVIEVATALNGVPISQARHILDEAARLIGWSHLVDASSERFTAIVAEYAPART